MSVYTPVDPSELRLFLRDYDVGHLIKHEGIQAGIENSNFFVWTSTGEYVLTLFERVQRDEIPYFLDFIDHLVRAGVPCAQPMRHRTDGFVTSLNQKPAALLNRLPGATVTQTGPLHCRSVGEALAQLHIAGNDFPQHRRNPFNLSWIGHRAEQVVDKLTSAQSALLRSEISLQQTINTDMLPRGTIHADVFRDNVLFDENQLTGIIDFYYACEDVLLLDVAITLNDWCLDSHSTLDDELFGAFMQGYETIRTITDLEHELFPVLLRRAALRFWLSRLYDSFFPRDGESVLTKDPAEIELVLRNHI